MIAIKINRTKITKSRLYKGKDGALYLDAILIPSQKFGNDFMIVESMTKEERDSGKQGVILGNGKNLGGGASSQTGNPERPTTPPVEFDDMPF